MSPELLAQLRSYRDQWWTAELDALAVKAEAIGGLDEAYARAAAREVATVRSSSQSSATVTASGLNDDWREQHGLFDVPPLTSSFAYLLFEELRRVLGEL